MKKLSKSISSPSRTDLFPPPLMSFLRADAGNRSKSGRSRSSPIFVGKKNVVAIETQEPSSPKVTCMGQVRASSNKTPAARCRWIRSVLSFNRRNCRTFWNSSAMFFRRKYEIRRKSSIFESRVGNEAEDSEKDEENDGGARDAVFSSSVPSPPKNALILTRCRSAPNRASFYGNRYRSRPITSDGSGEEEEKAEEDLGNSAASEIELRKKEGLWNKVENAKGDGDCECVDRKERTMEEKSMLNRKLILTRCKSEPARIAEKMYGELNLREEERNGDFR
ncbi:uncharacterized protein LOC120073931 [Benincasa hispida]|uniref:uncharacterized protein LOC120073931 n=1 Tax=Benincasa hispida TaxID=102211 RepID=UPI0019005539|nr:uncharacterized protein LOC120073931 [Benincasa hispida]